MLATTDGAGEFHVAAAGNYYLQVEKEGFAPRWALQQDLSRGKAFDVMLEEKTRVGMELTLAEGRPAAGAVMTGVTMLENVALGGKIGPFEVRAVADGAGRVELPVERGEVGVSGGVEGGAVCGCCGDGGARGEVMTKKVALLPGVRVRVRAVDLETGAAIAGVKLMFEKLAPGAISGMAETEIVTGSDGTAVWGPVGPCMHGIEWRRTGMRGVCAIRIFGRIGGGSMRCG